MTQAVNILFYFIYLHLKYTFECEIALLDRRFGGILPNNAVVSLTTGRNITILNDINYLLNINAFYAAF